MEGSSLVEKAGPLLLGKNEVPREAAISTPTPSKPRLTREAQALDAARLLVNPPEAEAGPRSLEGSPRLCCIRQHLGCRTGASGRHQHECVLVGRAIVQRLGQVQQLCRLALGGQRLLQGAGVGVDDNEAAAGAAGTAGNRRHLQVVGTGRQSRHIHCMLNAAGLVCTQLLNTWRANVHHQCAARSAAPHLDVVLNVVRHAPQHQLAQARGPPKVQGPQQAAVAVVQGHHLAGGGQRHNLLAEAVCGRAEREGQEAGAVGCTAWPQRN